MTTYDLVMWAVLAVMYGGPVAVIWWVLYNTVPRRKDRR